MLIFLHGTLIMHAAGAGRSRAERVAQVREQDPSVLQYENYVPVGEAVTKLSWWAAHGAEIHYLSSHTAPEDVAKDALVLSKYQFPSGEILFRRGGEGYQDIAQRLVPDVIIEDDCESIGGAAEMTYSNIVDRLKPRIKSIVVKEFAGIDHLPESLMALLRI